MPDTLIWKANIFTFEAQTYIEFGYTIGEPRGNALISTDELKTAGMVGIYTLESSDPSLHHGEIYFSE